MTITANTLGKLLGHEPTEFMLTPGRVVSPMAEPVHVMVEPKSKHVDLNENAKQKARDKAKAYYQRNREKILAQQKASKQTKHVQAKVQPERPLQFNGVNIDQVSHPVSQQVHYTGNRVQCIDALEAATTHMHGIEAVCTAMAIEHLWNWKQKNGVEDLKTARVYLDRLIDVTKEAR